MVITLEEDVDPESISPRDESYFLSKIVSDNPTRFRPFGIDHELRSKARDLVRSKHAKDSEDLRGVVENPELVKEVLPEEKDLEDLIPLRRVTGRLFRINGKGLLVDNNDGTFHVIAKNKTEGEELACWIEAEVRQVAKVTADFNLTLDKLLRGRDFALGLVKQVENLVAFEERTPKNPFEKDVAEGISAITNATLANVEASFAKPVETQEYDVLLPIANDFILDIEVKDYEAVKKEIHSTNENLKQKIVSGPADKAGMMEATPIVVVKGFPPEVFSQLKEIATSRKVNLLDVGNYRLEIEKIILKHLLRRVGRSMYPTRRTTVRARDLISYAM